MSQLVVIVDTREQHPYAFDPEKIRVVRRALPAGDYSIEGHESTVAVERKSLDDFASTVIHSRGRFRKELKLLESYDAACVVVEAGLRDILMGKYRTGAHPHAVFGSAISITVDFSIPVFFCSDRQVALRFVQEYLLRLHRKLNSQCPAEKTAGS
ncbi:MAG: hypothetical protein GY854_32200 [Deltaproteobacteria bacterium]|nr:hypothetical protein [Deltaproteobacteria bacterium]